MPTRMRLVCAAYAASSVQPSRQGPVKSPAMGMKWSKSQACSTEGMESASSQTRSMSSLVVFCGAVLIPKLSLLPIAIIYCLPLIGFMGVNFRCLQFYETVADSQAQGHLDRRGSLLESCW